MSRKITVFATLIPCLIIIATILLLTSREDSSFKVYEPTILPAGLNIEGHKETRWNWDSKDFERSIEYEIILNTKDVSISENRRTKEADDAMQCEEIGNEICQTLRTPLGHSYTQLSTKDLTGNIDSVVVRYIKDDTYIWLTVQKGEDNGYTSQNWGPILDSLEPIPKSKNITVEYLNYGP